MKCKQRLLRVPGYVFRVDQCGFSNPQHGTRNTRLSLIMKPYVLLINALLIGATIYLVGISIYALTSLPPEPPALESGSTPNSVAQTTLRQRPVNHYRGITQRNLFQTGNASKAKPPPQLDVSSLKPTQLKLKLWGTVTGPDGATWAVIEESGKAKQQLYKEGETIQEATVKRILRNKIVLSLRGKDEVLEIEEVTAKISRSTPVVRRKAAPRRRSVILRRNQIERVTQSAEDITQQAQINVYEENGSAAGIVISNIRPRSIFRQMRLINGDVLQEINGQRLTSPQDAAQLYQQVQTASEITLQIQRRGRPRTIQYRIR